MILTILRYACLLCLLLSAAAACAGDKAPADTPRDIFIMRRDGTGVRRVVFIESYPQLGSPRFSHDGQRLAFDARGSRPARALLIDTSGNNLLDLGAGERPDWSPDDKQVAFEVPGAERASVWVQNADGRGNSWLVGGSMPRWSPDGSQIAYLAPKEPLHRLDLITGDKRPVVDLNDEISAILGYDWAPDGTRMAVVVQRRGRAEQRLLLVNLENRSLRVRLEGHLSGAPSFSPDGKHLALAIGDPESDTSRLYLLEVAGDQAAELIPHQQGNSFDPAFSPDGGSLAFASTRRAPAE